MKKLIITILLVLMLVSCDPLVDGFLPAGDETMTPEATSPGTVRPEITEPEIVIIDDSPPIFDTNALLPIRGRLIDFSLLENTNISANAMGLKAYDDVDGDISDRITYELIGYENLSYGYYYIARYKVSDSSNNTNTIDIPFIVYMSLQINESNFSELFDIQVLYSDFGRTYSGDQIVYAEVFISPLETVNLEILSSFIRIDNITNYSWSQTVYRRPCSGSCTLRTDKKSIQTSISVYPPSGLYSDDSVVFLDSKSTELWGTKFSITSTAEYASVGFSQVTKSTTFKILGSAEVRLFITDIG